MFDGYICFIFKMSERRMYCMLFIWKVILIVGGVLIKLFGLFFFDIYLNYL